LPSQIPIFYKWTPSGSISSYLSLTSYSWSLTLSMLLNGLCRDNWYGNSQLEYSMLQHEHYLMTIVLLYIVYCGFCRGINLVWNLWIVGQGLKTGRLWALKVQQMEACSSRLRVSSPEFLFNCSQILIFLKSHHFGKCYYLIFLYIIGHSNISRRPHDPSIIKSGESRLPSKPLRTDAFDSVNMAV